MSISSRSFDTFINLSAFLIVALYLVTFVIPKIPWSTPVMLIPF